MGFSPSNRHFTTASIFGNVIDATTGSFTTSLTISGVPVSTGDGGGLANVVEDTTPQLGGNLDAQDNDITDIGTVTVGDGSLGAPSIAFASAPTTGMFLDATSLFLGRLGVAGIQIGGSAEVVILEKMSFAAGKGLSFGAGGFISGQSSFFIAAGGTTILFGETANAITFTVGGDDWILRDSHFEAPLTTSVIISGDDNAGSTPPFSFKSQPNSGMLLVDSGDPSAIGFSCLVGGQKKTIVVISGTGGMGIDGNIAAADATFNELTAVTGTFTTGLTIGNGSTVITASRITTGSIIADNTPGKNIVINGNFDIWQRGTSFTSTSAYTADRWLGFSSGSNTMVFDRQTFTVGQTDVPGEPQYFYRINKTDGSGTPELLHRIEDVRTCAGETVTLSWWAKASISRDLTPVMAQNFGSGGSSQVNTNLATTSLTTSWQKFTRTVAIDSISGKTVGSSNYLMFFFQWASTTNGTIDIAQVQLEKGSIATEFERRPIGTELALCQRYYCKTFPQSVTPAAPGGQAGSILVLSAGTGSADVALTWDYPVTMRINPTVTLYNPSAAGTDMRDLDAAANRTAAVQAATSNDRMLMVENLGSTGDGNRHILHVTADAEL